MLKTTHEKCYNLKNLSQIYLYKNTCGPATQPLLQVASQYTWGSVIVGGYQSMVPISPRWLWVHGGYQSVVAINSWWLSGFRPEHKKLLNYIARCATWPSYVSWTNVCETKRRKQAQCATMSKQTKINKNPQFSEPPFENPLFGRLTIYVYRQACTMRWT